VALPVMVGVGAFRLVCDDAATCRGGDVDEQRAAAEDLVALRTALLGLHAEFLAPLPGRRTRRVVRRLRRPRLSWLLVPWFLLYMARGMRRALRGSVAEQARAERLYGRLSGKDPHVAQAEVFRMVEQLGQLDAREHWLDEDAPGPQKGADRAELEAAADALLGYYLAGRRTDDELLGEVQAAWGEYEALTHERAQRVLQEGPRRGRPRPDHEERVQAARDRYLLAWRRWLDRQAPRASSSGSGRQ
jgi:hypothetical protein